MRYKPGQKEETRQKILDAASQCFRRQGFAGIGVDGLAKAAGVTSGAFYTHFKSKNAAFEAALIYGLDQVITALPEFQKKEGARWVVAFAEYYMSKAHREDLGCGCAMATLTPEVIRSSPEIHQVFEEKMARIADLITQGLEGGDMQEKRGRAWALLSILIGGVSVARGMSSAASGDEVASAIVYAAIQSAGSVHG